MDTPGGPLVASRTIVSEPLCNQSDIRLRRTRSDVLCTCGLHRLRLIHCDRFVRSLTSVERVECLANTFALLLEVGRNAEELFGFLAFRNQISNSPCAGS